MIVIAQSIQAFDANSRIIINTKGSPILLMQHGAAPTKSPVAQIVRQQKPIAPPQEAPLSKLLMDFFVQGIHNI